MTDVDGACEISTVTMKAGGILTSYYEAGQENSEPLLLLHGMSSSADTFRELISELAQSYWIVAPDIPGFGGSEDMRPYTFFHLTRWLRAFVVELGTGPVHLAGHSFGGALAVSYALAEPDDVRKLVLLAPSILRPGKYPPWLRRFARSSVTEWVLELGISASRVMLQRQMRAAFYNPSKFDPSLWERRKRDYLRARASAAVLRASALHDIRDELHRIKQPSCIIWGTDDPVLESDDAAILSDLMPGSYTDLHLLPECGHIPHIEQYGQVIEILQYFLATE